MLDTLFPTAVIDNYPTNCKHLLSPQVLCYHQPLRQLAILLNLLLILGVVSPKRVDFGPMLQLAHLCPAQPPTPDAIDAVLLLFLQADPMTAYEVLPAYRKVIFDRVP